MNIPLNKLLIFQTEQVSAKGKGGGGVGTAPPEMSMTEVPHMPEEEVKLGTWTVTYPNGDKVKHPCSGDQYEKWRGVGHISSNGGGELNPFGQAFMKSNFVSELSTFLQRNYRRLII